MLLKDNIQRIFFHFVKYNLLPHVGGSLNFKDFRKLDLLFYLQIDFFRTLPQPTPVMFV